MKKMTICLWFDGNASAASQFYTSHFEFSKTGNGATYSEAAAEISGQKKDSVMTVDFEIANTKFLALNGGPIFKQNPAVSLFVYCKDEAEINYLWKNFSNNGTVLMGLDKYPWSEKYGWCNDQFGVSWQFMLGANEQKIVPSFLFSKSLFGKGEAAINFYLKVFKDSKLVNLQHHPNNENKTILFSSFILNGQQFNLMEGPNHFEPTPAMSFMVSCADQAEVDYYWEELVKDGGSHSNCGWLQDQFKVSWQIIPTAFEKIMKSADKQKAERVMKALLKMKKIDIATLENA